MKNIYLQFLSILFFSSCEEESTLPKVIAVMTDDQYYGGIDTNGNDSLFPNSIGNLRRR